LKAGIEMKEINNSPTCERASDLIAFLYDEATESEARDFKLHLQECSSCRGELASFGLVRESITAWRDEALSGFVSTPLPARVTSKSALAALRQFFDLSPLWLKAATGFAVLAFCALAVLAFVRLQPKQPVLTAGNPHAIYSQEDVNRMVNEALAKQTLKAPETPKPETVAIVKTPAPKPKRAAVSTQMAKSRRPLSRAEREQLASDLRLLSNQDDARLNLLSDRINQ
jgi:hypothetical protein